MNMIISDSFRKVNIKTDSSIKAGICTLCKEENLYIQEFIDYYRDLGYNHIFIYDNNDIDGKD